MDFKCPLSEHNFECMNETISEENSTHGLYLHIYDEKGNLIDKLKVGTCNDTLPIHIFDYTCTACSASYSKRINENVIHHPSYNDSIIHYSAD